jgi:hypothetical protein
MPRNGANLPKFYTRKSVRSEPTRIASIITMLPNGVESTRVNSDEAGVAEAAELPVGDAEPSPTWNVLKLPRTAYPYHSRKLDDPVDLLHLPSVAWKQTLTPMPLHLHLAVREDKPMLMGRKIKPEGVASR